ncbi:MAG: metal-dependent transcriptional regulator [Chloroflexota bacterium]|nr:metal-dependent transcriptional regulator [Chloroflexota bacterium]
MSTTRENRLSMAMENYLLSIIRLQEQDTKVTAAQLSEHFKSLPMAEGLGTSLPSVSAMIRRMTREKLVTTSSEKEISLTKSGLTEAESILRRHRLAERLAVDVLKVDLKRAHEEAHRLEHAFSPYLESRVVDILDHPTTCPFGHPIPGSKYVSNNSSVSLNKAKVGHDYLVDMLPEDDMELLGYFVDNDFLPGAHIQITDLSNSRGVITLKLGNKELVFSMGISNLIRVSPA